MLDKDLKFLRTLQTTPGTDKSMSNLNFRNVSVITALNSFRDKINDIGCECFVWESGQSLTTFYSIDRMGTGTRSRRKKIEIDDPLRNTNTLAVGLQNELWDLPPSNTENRAGKLKLCIGKPIMIKYNEATECGVTNGAEGIVVGWKARNMDSERQFLQVLFVKLTSAPVPIKLYGLP